MTIPVRWAGTVSLPGAAALTLGFAFHGWPGGERRALLRDGDRLSLFDLDRAFAGAVASLLFVPNPWRGWREGVHSSSPDGKLLVLSGQRSVRSVDAQGRVRCPPNSVVEAVAFCSYETYDDDMRSTAHAHTDDTPADSSHPVRRRHLAVVPDEFADETAAATGSSRNSVLAALAMSLLVSHSELPADHSGYRASDFTNIDWEGEGAESLGNLSEILSVAESLAENFQTVVEQLRSVRGVEVASSEMRTHWSQHLDRVRTGGELLYVTQHGNRVAALVPPHVADFYRDAEDRVDAAAIDAAAADREAGVPAADFEDLAEELGR